MEFDPRSGFLFPTNGEPKPIAPPKNGKDYSLEECQAMVDGYIEVALRVTVEGVKMIVLVNEEGLIENLPYNPAASLMCGMDLVGPVAVIPGKMFK